MQIEETRHFTGANIYASSNALWIRFGSDDSAHNTQAEMLLVEKLSAVGLKGASIASKAADTAPDLPVYSAMFALALVEILEKGAMKTTAPRPRVLAIDPVENSCAVATPGEINVPEAVALLLGVFNGTTEESTEALRRFINRALRNAAKPVLSVILKAAEGRGIPWLWNSEVGYYQLGHGCHRKWIEATITGNLSVLGYDVARRKSLANQLLRSLALPAPQSVVTTDVDEAIAAALKIGYPVVVKPMIGHKGIGITVGVASDHDLLDAFKKARKINKSVIIEQLILGGDTRLLVVGRKLVAAASRNPPQVKGDGQNPVARLIEIENARRLTNPGVALPIEVDGDLRQTLLRQGLRLDSILPAGATARLRTVANWSQGGTTTDITDIVHPDNADMAVRAALAVGVDVAGIDFITPDITRPYYDVGGAICEINYRPGLRVHLAADVERKRDLGTPIVDSMFSGHGRIDIVFLLDADNSETTEKLAKCYAQAGKNATVVDAYNGADDWQAKIELAFKDPDCDSLIVNAPAAAVLEKGTGLAYCSLVVRFANDAPPQAQAMLVLEQICGPGNLLSREREEPGDGMLSSIIKAMQLIPSANLPALPPAKITTSRGMWEIAGKNGLWVEECVRWNDKALMQYGYGATRAIYRGARTGKTSLISTCIADDKQCTNALLRAYGLPHAAQAIATSTESALRAANTFGYPVIIKPSGSSESRGVTGNILFDAEVVAAAKLAFGFSKKIIVEPFLPGVDHRFLIIGGKMAHATRHETAHVTGDGIATIEELVAIANKDPSRGPMKHQPYTWLNVDRDAERLLARQGLTAKSIPHQGHIVELSSICSLSTGGTAVDVTVLAHPDNIHAAERATRLAGLDICGVDFLLPDVTKSYHETGGAILEVNQRPSFDMHDASTNAVNQIRSLVLREMLGGDEIAQIPLLHCVLDNACPTEEIARAVVSRLRTKCGMTGGVAMPALNSAVIGTSTIKAKSGAADEICRSILADPRVHAAVFLTDGKRPKVVPDRADFLDLRSSKHVYSVDEIAEAILARLRLFSLEERHRTLDVRLAS